MSDVSAIEKTQQRRDSQTLAGLARDVDIVGSGLLERESHELPPTLDLWPVKKPIRHTATPNAVTRRASWGNRGGTEPYNE